MKCTRPIKIDGKKNGIKYTWEVPCNRCIACKKTKITEWTARIKAEISEKHINSHFLTLTYSDENLPYVKSVSSLSKKNIQDFHKRLRKKEKFKYFTVGEYGDTTLRPHYHGIYIGIKDLTNVQKAWGYGLIYPGTVTDKSIKYVISYIIQKGKKEDYLPAETPFQLNSNNIGVEWLKKNLEDVCKDGYLRYNGNKIAIPKTWKDKYPEVKKSGTNARLRFIKKYKNWKDLTNEWYNEGLKKEINEREQLELKNETKEKRHRPKSKI